MKIGLQEIRDKEQRLEHLKRQYLTERGWQYRCDFPDSCWRWVKKFERGGVITARLDNAVHIESRRMAVKMTERRLLVDAREARGLASGEITAVVRVIEPQPTAATYELVSCGDLWRTWLRSTSTPHGWRRGKNRTCPFGVPGDRLWVAEEWYYDSCFYLQEGPANELQPGEYDPLAMYYHAEGECCDQIPECCCGEVGKPTWRPAREMTRWLARTLLEVVAVKPVRAWKITEEDAKLTGYLPLYVPVIDDGTGEHLGDQPSYRYALQQLFANKWLWLAHVKRVQDEARKEAG
jgi:hypothetical protein